MVDQRAARRRNIDIKRMVSHGSQLVCSSVFCVVLFVLCCVVFSSSSGFTLFILFDKDLNKDFTELFTPLTVCVVLTQKNETKSLRVKVLTSQYIQASKPSFHSNGIQRWLRLEPADTYDCLEEKKLMLLTSSK